MPNNIPDGNLREDSSTRSPFLASPIPNMQVFITWDGDGIGKMVGRAELADDPAKIRRIAQQIDAGNEIFRSWCERTMGEVINVGGDEGRIAIDPKYLGELPGLCETYETASGATCSVGVGMKLSHSAKALLVAKLRGKNRIIMFTPDLDPEIKAAVEAHDAQNPASKEIEEYLKFEKAEEAAAQGAEAAPAEPQQPAPPPEKTSEDEFHSHATAHANGVRHESAIKQGLMLCLQTVQQQMPQIEQLKQQNPDLYQTIIGLTQELINVAHDMFGKPEAGGGADKPSPKVQKSELSKGSLQARTPYNPQQAKRAMGADSLDNANAWASGVDIADRSKFPRMEGHERSRALSKLTAATKTRRSPTGEVEFLLHRGMGPEEHNKTVTTFGQNTHANEPYYHTSWTPKHQTAKNFADQYSTTRTGSGMPHSPPRTVSAWIPEKHIHSIPKQLGNLNGVTTKGSMGHANEHEVIVGPHKSQIAKPGVDFPTTRLADLHGRINQAGKEDKNMFQGNRGDQEIQRARPVFAIQRLRGIGDVKKSEEIDPSKAKDCPKERIGELLGCEVFLVDGSYIRDNVDIEYTEGGNHGRYSWIPENEIWLENSHNEMDVAACALHEHLESRLMDRGMSYDDAHTRASAMEKKFRAQFEGADKDVNLAQAGAWFQENADQEDKAFKKSEGDHNDPAYWAAQSGAAVHGPYTLHYTAAPHKNEWSVEALAHNPPRTVGLAEFAGHRGPDGEQDGLKGWQVNVHPDHQRKGLATAMYAHAGKMSGMKIHSGDFQTPDGKAFTGNMKKSEGVTYTHEEKDHGEKHPRLHVQAHKDGQKVGHAEFHRKGAALYSTDLHVQPEHRRKGVATGIYAHAEKASGRKVIPSKDQTTMGKLFSHGRLNKASLRTEEAKSSKAAIASIRSGEAESVGTQTFGLSEKMKKGLPGNRQRNLTYLPGAIKDGKIKIVEPDTGKPSWKGVRSGMIRSNDNHAISSREPEGK